ncbi:O-methyltransferase-domain-containing protein [Lentinula guzmanii]|uniref:O-methyltransferase-domain-containing protein n=1 Tax=Lentinula guzmanii TaxID=2804957 RepID=A0AA38JY68_9AGAR|nr:O-methyltransferase-domain-containing protein [Lentinula guzmanii]
MTGPSEVQHLLKIIAQAANDALNEYARHGEEVPSIYETKTHPLDIAETAFTLKKAIRTLEGACNQLCSTLAPPLHTVINNAHDYYWSCLRVAAKQGLADILYDHQGGLHIEVLSQRLGINQDKLATIMRTLASRHCFREVAKDVYANNRLSLALRSQTPGAAFLDLQTCEGQQAAFYFQRYLDDPTYGPSTDLKHTAFTYSISGFQGTFYDWIKQNVMTRGMSGMNQVMGTLSILEVFPWEKYSTICDVGGGNGSFTWPLIQKYPALKVTMFDLPETIAAAEKVATQKINVNHVEFSSGNFFEKSPPHNLDIYYLRNIIHNWPDKSAVSILESVGKAMGNNSRLLIPYSLDKVGTNSSEMEELSYHIVQAPLPMLPDFGYGNMRLHNQDLTMLFMYNSKERTVVELMSLSQDAGLELSNVWDLGETAVLEFTKSNNRSG